MKKSGKLGGVAMLFVPLAEVEADPTRRISRIGEFAHAWARSEQARSLSQPDLLPVAIESDARRRPRLLPSVKQGQKTFTWEGGQFSVKYLDEQGGYFGSASLDLSFYPTGGARWTGRVTTSCCSPEPYSSRSAQLRTGNDDGKVTKRPM